MRIEVTQADIDAGSNSYMFSCRPRPESCPICEAIKRTTSATRVSVYPGKPYFASNAVAVIGDLMFQLPERAIRWANKFDAYNGNINAFNPKPFTFTLGKEVRRKQ